jgi:hypothetical protein
MSELVDIFLEITAGDSSELPGIRSWTKFAVPLPLWLIFVGVPSSTLVGWIVFFSLQCVAKFAYQLFLQSVFALAAAAVFSAAAVLCWRAFIAFPAPPAIQAGASQKRVAIIGGGSVGLVCAKSVLEEGMGAVIFEKTGGIGGLWQFDEELMSV